MNGTGARWATGLVLGLAFAPACGGLGGGVARVVDGRVQHGRYISPESYAAYARGAQLEALGHYRGAELAYEEALAGDPNSVGIWTRLGSVRCAMAMGHPNVDESFEHAAELDPDFAGLWYERGRCDLRRQQFKAANTAALRALALDPLHLPSTMLVVETFLRLKQPKDAFRYLDAAIALRPSLAELGYSKDAMVRDGTMPKFFAVSQGIPPSLPELDRALLSDTNDTARELALALEIPEGEVAARAVALGKTRAGSKRANHVHQADPSEGTAWVTLLSSADLMRDEALYEATLNALDEAPTPPSPLGTVLFADLLKRRVGEDAARAWLQAAATPPPDDPLVARQLRRLETELNAASHGDAHPGDASQSEVAPDAPAPSP